MKDVQKKKFTPTFYEIDFQGKLKLSALFNYFQDVACTHIARQGIGCDFLDEKGLIWALGKMRLEMERFPEEGETVLIESWNRGTRRFYVERDFEVFANGKRIGGATSCWLLMDKNSRKLARLESCGREVPVIERNALDKNLSKMVFPEVTNEVYSHNVLYSSLDRQNHVNNALYLDWIYNAFTRDELEKFNFSGMEISYISEACFNDIVDIRRASGADGEHYIEGVNRNTGERIFQTRLSFNSPAVVLQKTA